MSSEQRLREALEAFVPMRGFCPDCGASMEFIPRPPHAPLCKIGKAIAALASTPVQPAPAALTEQQAFDKWNNSPPFDDIGDGTTAGALRAGFRGGFTSGQAAQPPVQQAGARLSEAVEVEIAAIFKAISDYYGTWPDHLRKFAQGRCAAIAALLAAPSIAQPPDDDPMHTCAPLRWLSTQMGNPALCGDRDTTLGMALVKLAVSRMQPSIAQPIAEPREKLIDLFRKELCKYCAGGMPFSDERKLSHVKPGRSSRPNTPCRSWYEAGLLERALTMLAEHREKAPALTCTHCGKQMPDAMRFCSNCWNDLAIKHTVAEAKVREAGDAPTAGSFSKDADVVWPVRPSGTSAGEEPKP